MLIAHLLNQGISVFILLLELHLLCSKLLLQIVHLQGREGEWCSVGLSLLDINIGTCTGGWKRSHVCQYCMMLVCVSPR